MSDLDRDGLSGLEEALEKQIEQMDFSEFEDEEEDWSLFKRNNAKKQPEKTEDEDIPENETASTGRETKLTEGEDDSWLDEEDADSGTESDEEDEESDQEDAEIEEDAESDDDSDHIEDDDLDYPDDDEADLDEEYIQSAAYKKRERRTLSYEQREARRERRITFFWDFVVQNRRRIRWVLISLLVVIGAVAAGIVSRNWTYHNMKELVVSEKEDTLSVSYSNINGNILKYGVDSAMLVDQNNTMLWTVSYTMTDPEVDLCGETFVIYDSKGTSMIVCGIEGQMGELSSDMPIVKANVSTQGVVAAILEDGENAWIKLYSKDGSEIASLKTTFSNPGYPMDIALSPDGTLMAVNYLYMDNGTPVSRVAFYNFGTVGQNQQDNLVAESEYRDNILPEAEYLDSGSCVVFREDGFSVFTGSQIPSETVTVDTDSNIVSTFCDSEYIGLVLQNLNSEYDYTICLYNLKGREVVQIETDFQYDTVELNEGQIVLASEDEICVYSTEGVEKYRDALEAPAKVFIGFGRNKFIYVSEDLFRIVQIS